MEARLFVAVLFVCAVCHFTEAQFLPSTPLTTNITHTTCGSSKLCVSSPGNCDPSGNSSCFFSSIQLGTGVLTVEISGRTSGFVALGLTPTTNLTQPLKEDVDLTEMSEITVKINSGTTFQGVTGVFVCGNNSTNSSFFFATANQNGTQLVPYNMDTVNITGIQGALKENQSLIQCTFNITINSTSTQLPFNVTIFKGTTNRTELGNATVVFSSFKSLDLADPTNNVKLLNIRRNGCGSSKLCVSTASNCDPAGNSSCFFSSVQAKNQTLFVELSGTTTGYVALGLSKQGSTFVFACGNDSYNFFFQTATRNGTSLSPANVTTVYSYDGVVAQNQTLIQCVFNISTSLNVSTKADDTTYNVTIMNGTTNGTVLGNATSLFSSGPLDLAKPKSNIPVVLLNITRNGCGSSKLCVSTASNCDPAGNSSCFFSSVQAKNQTFFVELSGTTTGYVALGLSKQGSTFVFACGNDSYNFFFQTATRNGTSLSPANVTTVYSYDGVVAQNQTLIQCVFNISTSLNISTKADDTTYNVTIMNGTTNGTVLGNATSLFSSGPLDLANPKSNIPVELLNITRNGCGSSKLCFSSTSNCNTTGNSSCFFSSVQMKSQNFSFELSGTTTGYVALGLAKQNSTVVFICGNDTNGSNFFFETAVKNGTGLTLKNVTTVYSKQGVVAQSQTLIQCFFNTTNSFNFSTKGEDTMYQVTIMNGTTNGTKLGDPVVQYDSKAAVDLSDPAALNSAVSLCTNVLAVLLSALILRLL